MSDRRLAKWFVVLLLLPLGLALYSEERFRYPCQDPMNWDKDICKMPLCDVTRSCPEHIFKGQRDPRLGPPNEQNNSTTKPSPQVGSGSTSQGANCAR